MAVAAAACRVPRSTASGHTPSTPRSADFEIGWDELDRDTEWAHSLLVRGGHQEGRPGAVQHPEPRGPVGLPHSSARFAASERRTPPRRPTAGTRADSRCTCAGFRSRRSSAWAPTRSPALATSEGSVAELLCGVDLVWARPDAVPRLAALQIEAATYAPLGPALGLGMPGRARRARERRGVDGLGEPRSRPGHEPSDPARRLRRRRHRGIGAGRGRRLRLSSSFPR